MLKVKSCMELEVNGRKYEFYCPPDSPLQDAVEANMQFNAFLLGRLEQNKQLPQEKPCDPPTDQVPAEQSE